MGRQVSAQLHYFVGADHRCGTIWTSIKIVSHWDVTFIVGNLNLAQYFKKICNFSFEVSLNSICSHVISKMCFWCNKKKTAYFCEPGLQNCILGHAHYLITHLCPHCTPQWRKIARKYANFQLLSSWIVLGPNIFQNSMYFQWSLSVSLKSMWWFMQYFITVKQRHTCSQSRRYNLVHIVVWGIKFPKHIHKTNQKPLKTCLINEDTIY